MAMFRVEMGVGHLDGGELVMVRPMVDASADHSMLPESLLEQLRIVPQRRLGFTLANGDRAEYGYGIARLCIDGDELPCPVLFGPEGAYVLGASALGTFNLEEDQDSESLVPAKWLSLGCAGQDDHATGAARPTAVAPLEGYRIWLRYSDGVAGDVDLSDLAGCGVFSAWNDRSVFESVRLTADGAVVWSSDIDLCPDDLYMRLTGESAGEVMTEAQVLTGNA